MPPSLLELVGALTRLMPHSAIKSNPSALLKSNQNKLREDKAEE